MFAKRGFLLDVARRTPNRRTLFELVDILYGYRYTEFRPYAEDGFDDVEIDFKKLGLYCEMQGLKMIPTTKADFDLLFAGGEYICVSTETERSLAGRVEDMRERMEKAEAMGRAHGMKGFLVTDLGDECAWQPLAASLPGVIMGANFAVSGPSTAKMDLEKELNRVMNAPIGGLLLRLGTLYLRGGAPHEHCSELFNILSHDVGYSRHPGLTDYVLEDVGGVARGVRIAAERWADESNWAKEIVHMANLIDAACHRRDEKRLREVRDEHGRIWRLRSMESERAESLMRLPRF